MDRKLNIIDCPGSDDFCGSLFSAFKVGDVGVFLFNAQNGWEAVSYTHLGYVAVCWLLLWFLDRKKIYLKI